MKTPAATNATTSAPSNAQSSQKASRVYSDLHRVGLGFSVQFSCTPKSFDGVVHVHAEWTPHMPTPRQMRRVAQRYEAALAEFAPTVGRAVA